MKLMNIEEVKGIIKEMISSGEKHRLLFCYRFSRTFVNIDVPKVNLITLFDCAAGIEKIEFPIRSLYSETGAEKDVLDFLLGTINGIEPVIIPYFEEKYVTDAEEVR